MVFDLIATVFAGVALGGIILFLKRNLHVPISGWVIPAAAGAAMIAFAIWSEYSWFKRDLSSRPEGTIVVWKSEKSAFWRPWTYFAPITDRYRALDTSSLESPTPNTPMVGQMILAERWQKTIVVRSAFDCKTSTWTSALDGAVFSANGRVVSDVWHEMANDDPLNIAACQVNG